MEAFDADQFRPMSPSLECGCEKHSPLVPCDIMYVDEQNVCHRVCFRQQCPSCGFLRKNKLGKTLFYSIVEASRRSDMFNFLPEYFWAPDEYCFDERREYDRRKKIDFIRRILTLANRNETTFGHLYFTKKEIDAVELYKKIA